MTHAVPIAAIAATACLDKPARPMALATIAVLPAIVSISALHGSGPWHMAPFAPVLASLLIGACAALRTRWPRQIEISLPIAVPMMLIVAIAGLWLYDYRWRVDLATPGRPMWRSPEVAAARAALIDIVDGQTGKSIVFVPASRATTDRLEIVAAKAALRSIDALPVRHGGRLLFTWLSWADNSDPARLTRFVERLVAPCAADLIVRPRQDHRDESRMIGSNFWKAVEENYMPLPGSGMFEVWICRSDTNAEPRR